MKQLTPRYLTLADNVYWREDRQVIEREIKKLTLEEFPGLVPKFYIAYQIDVPNVPNPEDEPVIILDIAINVYNDQKQLVPGSSMSWPITLLTKKFGEREYWPLELNANHGGWYVKQTGKYSVCLDVDGTNLLEAPLFIRKK